ncbi:MAG: LamG-like jellyroll fold domain-containing protein [Limisphaerales bacterium]
MIDGPDIVLGADGKVDAVETFNKENADTASLTDPNTGEEIGKKYGAFIGAVISQDLAPYIEARVNDDAIESKRVEFRRIAQADGKTTVRFRFAQAGTGSWYFGIDNLGIYEVTQVDPPKIDVQPLATTAYEGFPLKLTVSASGVGLKYQWTLNGTPISGATQATYTVAKSVPANAGNYAVTVINEGGSVDSSTVAVAVRPVPTSFPVNDGLAAYFKFDGDLSDASGNSRNGEAVGAPGSVDGKLGKALEYTSLKDGSSFNYVKVGGTPIDFSTTDFTVAFWAKLNTWEGDPGFIGNKNWNSGSNPGWVIATAGDGRIQWNIADEGRTRKDYDSAGGLFNDGTWHHVTVVFSRAGNAVTYFDGIEVNATSIAGLGKTGTPADLALNIGQDGTGTYTDGGGVGVDKGQIDDVAIWTRTLSAAEVATIVVGGNNGKPLSALVPPTVDLAKDLALHLPFDGSYADNSGNSRNGTAVGAPGLTDGKVGQSLEYSSNKDGSSFNFVTVGGTPIDFSTTDFSVAFWAKISKWEGDPSFISNKDWNSGGNQGFVVATAGDGRIQWNIADETRTRKDYDSAGGKFNDGGWHHVAVVFARSGNAVSYFDGVEVDSSPISGLGSLATPAGQALNIGQDGKGTYTDGGGVGIEKGRIDEVAVWTRALTADDVTAAYNKGTSGQPIIPVAPVAGVSVKQNADGSVTLTWTGELQSSDTLSGTFAPIVGATSPLTISAQKHI